MVKALEDQMLAHVSCWNALFATATRCVISASKVQSEVKTILMMITTTTMTIEKQQPLYLYLVSLLQVGSDSLPVQQSAQRHAMPRGLIFSNRSCPFTRHAVNSELQATL